MEIYFKYKPWNLTLISNYRINLPQFQLVIPPPPADAPPSPNCLPTPFFIMVAGAVLKISPSPNFGWNLLNLQDPKPPQLILIQEAWVFELFAYLYRVQ